MPRGQSGATYWQLNAYKHHSTVIYILSKFQMQSILN